MYQVPGACFEFSCLPVDSVVYLLVSLFYSFICLLAYSSVYLFTCLLVLFVIVSNIETIRSDERTFSTRRRVVVGGETYLDFVFLSRTGGCNGFCALSGPELTCRRSELWEHIIPPR